MPVSEPVTLPWLAVMDLAPPATVTSVASNVPVPFVSAAPLGSFAIANTGGWQSWHLVPANISAVTGTHTVYITLTSGQPADYVNLDWISFGH